MKLSKSRSRRNRGRHGRRMLTVLLVAVFAVMIGGGAVLFFRSRTPILPVRETNHAVDAIHLWNNGDYEGVMETTSVQLATFPLDETPLTLRGFSSFYRALEVVDNEEKQELLVGAVQDLRRVLLLPDPVMEAQVRYVLGKAYFHRGQFFHDSAIRELEYARSLGANSLDMLEYLALAYSGLQKHDEAISNFEAAVKLGDEDIHRVYLADILIRESRHEEAQDLLRTVMDSTGDTLLKQHSLLSLGGSQRTRTQYAEALETFQELLEINPSSAEARYQLGETYLAMGENDRARFEWREALRLNPNHIESFQRLQEY